MDPMKDRTVYAKSGLFKSAFFAIPAWFGKFSELRSYLKPILLL